MTCTRDDIDIRVERPVSEVAVLRVNGEIDILGAPTLREYIEDRLPGSRALVLDLTGTTFFGAAGLSVLVYTSAFARQLRVTWALVGSRVVLRPLRVTALDHDLPVYPSFREAVLAVASELTQPTVESG